MVSDNFCARCGAAMGGRAMCSASGAAVELAEAADERDTSVAALDSVSLAASPVASPDSVEPVQPPIPRGRMALLMVNVVLLIVALTLVAWDVFVPPPAKGSLTPQRAAPTATATDVATNSPISTAGVPTPRATNTPSESGGSSPPAPPTATPRPKPTATPTAKPTATPLPPTPTGTPGPGG